MEPNSSDALQPLMSKSQANLRYLIYGLLNFDRVKLEKSTKNLIAISQYLPKTALPHHQSSIKEFEQLAQDQQQILEDLRQNFLENNNEQAAALFGKLITNCVKCHKIFRFGEKGKAKITH